MSATDGLPRRTVLAGLAGLAGMAAGARTAAAARDDLTEVVGQSLLVGFLGAEPEDAGTRQMLDHAAAGRIGGVLLLSRNIRSAAQLRRLTGAIRAAGKRQPLLIAVDQEGGAIQRLGPRAGFTAIQAARLFGQASPVAAERAYAKMAGELARAGVNLNLGPVVDLALGGRKGVIDGLGRAYSDDPGIVVRMAGAFIDAHRRAGILTAPKHFPGHGNTALDSHWELPDISKTWSDVELSPYRRLIGEDRAEAVMTAHLWHPRFSDAPGVPASLSARTTQALRRDLGFNGLIVTDDLQMAAVRRTAGSDTAAAVRALAAGADVMILSAHPTFDPGLVDSLHRAIAGAVASGRLRSATLTAAHARVTAVKRRWLAR